MDYLALKAADAALGIADPVAAAEALMRAGATLPRDIPRRDARSVLYFGGGYARIYRRVHHTTPPAPDDATAGAALARSAFDAAVTALMVLDSDSAVVEATSDAEWQGVQAVFGLLVYMEDVTATEHDALLALRAAWVPDWPETLNAGHIQTARAQ